jgi:DNA-binding transcriptional LysR family regulator
MVSTYNMIQLTLPRLALCSEGTYRKNRWIKLECVELRHLRYFTAVAENGGFGRAAQLLHVSQSAISEQIRDLEAELGAALFDRENRTIRLTPEGEQFLVDARAVLALAGKATANVQRSLHGELGTLTIGFFVGGTGKFFPAIIREFRHRFPHVQVGLVEMAPAMQHQGLLSGSIDLGFTRAVQPAQAAILRSEHFLTERLYAVLLKNHPMAKRRKISMRELAGERFVLNDRKYSPAVFDKVITLCTEAGFSPKIGATATVSSGVLALVEAGEGLAILPGGSQILSSEELAFLPLSDRNAVIDLVIAWAPQHEGPVLRSFLEIARKKRKKPPVDPA